MHFTIQCTTTSILTHTYRGFRASAAMRPWFVGFDWQTCSFCLILCEQKLSLPGSIMAETILLNEYVSLCDILKGEILSSWLVFIWFVQKIQSNLFHLLSFVAICGTHRRYWLVDWFSLHVHAIMLSLVNTNLNSLKLVFGWILLMNIHYMWSQQTAEW